MLSWNVGNHKKLEKNPTGFALISGALVTVAALHQTSVPDQHGTGVIIVHQSSLCPSS